LSTYQLVGLTLDLPRPSFVEGSTIDATVRATAPRDLVVEDGSILLIRTWNPYATR
jgi:hypothetical protein